MKIFMLINDHLMNGHDRCELYVEIIIIFYLEMLHVALMMHVT